MAPWWMSRVHACRSAATTTPSTTRPTSVTSSLLTSYSRPDSSPETTSSWYSSLLTYLLTSKKGNIKVAHTRLPVPEPILDLGSHPAGDVSHKPGGRLLLLSAMPAVTFPARRLLPLSLLGEQRHDGCEQFA